MIKVFIVDDSPTFIEAFRNFLMVDPDINVVGYAKTGDEAIAKIPVSKPDVVTMDIIMPGKDGLETTKKILETYPVPIVILTACYNSKTEDIMYDAMESGAVSIVPKPRMLSLDNQEALNVIKTIKIMSEVRVVKRTIINTKKPVAQAYEKPSLFCDNNKVVMVCIGASTGGPPVLKTILSHMPSDFPVPILVVQHIACSFLNGMVNWLQSYCKIKISIPNDGDTVVGGNVYFAPDNYHMGIDKNRRIFLSLDPPIHCVRPSVSFLFRSVLKSFGNRFLGVLLTGMGKDGAQEISQLHSLKGITIIQDKESSAVFGMPGEAIKLGAGTFILPPEKIAEAIINQVCKR